MNITRYSPVGTDLKSLVLGYQQIRGVIVDNPSGSWLYMPEITGYCPPYTKAWSIDVNPTVASISFLFRDGPAGQVSTLQGDPIQVTLFDTPVGNSPGIASGGGFIEAFTPVLLAETQLTTSIGGTTGVMLAAVTNKRYRVLTATLVYTEDTLTPRDSGQSVVLFASPASIVTNIRLRLAGMEHYVDDRVFPLGLDLPKSGGINYAEQCDWANADVTFTITYQLI